jgi:carboxyl-terminal processing protease
MLNKDKKGLSNWKGFLTGITLTTIVVLFIQAKPEDSFFEISKNLDLFTTIFRELNSYYVDPIEPGKMVKTGVDAMLHDLDPYTNYITESDMEDFEFMTTGKYGGIGASMRKRGDEIYVGDVYENSPAQKAGLHPGDQVISIENTQLKGKSIEDVSLLLKGSPGTQVNVKIKDAYTGEESKRIITRGEIEISSVPYAGLIGKDKNIAYVKLNQFTQGCAFLVRSSLDSLKNANKNLKGVVVDLRNNPGGLLEEAVQLCNIFVERGQLVVATKGKLVEMDKDYKTQGAPWDTKIPVTVLVNHLSASASEIFSGTIQDLDRGLVIGERSYGKGLVQVTRNIGYNAKLKLTTAKYYTPSGRCIQAIDYSHRNPDGSVGKIPDSLKKIFTTKGGRKVMSGGGIEPDVNVESDDMSKLGVTLYTKNYLFEYATVYSKQHSTIPPASEFSLNETEYENFTKWMEGKDYDYKSETELAIDSVKSLAEKEKYYDAIKADIATLKSKLVHDKQQDLLKNKNEIKKLLESEIVSRYYFLKGRIEQGFRYDNDVEKAINYIEQPTQLQSILQPKK